MTCIAALKNKRTGKITIAADRRASWDMSQAQRLPKPKVVRNGDLIIAGTGDCHLLELAAYVFEAPVLDCDSRTYMHYKFHKSLKRVLLDMGMVDEHKLLKVPVDSSTELVIACSGDLYSVEVGNPYDSVYDNKGCSGGLIQITELSVPYATGCGGQLAWGSLLTTENLAMKDKERLELALKVAAKVSPGCDDNIDFVSE